MTNKYLTVTALTKYLKRKLDTDAHLKELWLQGEISNFKHHSRGHMYLTIKDDNSRIQAVMFAGNNRRLKFIPENGMKVLIKGSISVFEPFGQYQLYIQQMEPDGLGSLYLAYEQLKEKLAKQGYFKEEQKKAIPIFPENIGIVTSPTGAAVRDVITTIKRRYPIVQTTVIPVLVQGEFAAKSISQAIKQVNQSGLFDVLIIGRGGGSIEELWSFNEEIVAEAIYDSSIPIISAVGHETDTTISDYVADLRAPTPTGAAELAVPSITDLIGKLNSRKQSMFREVSNIIMNNEKHLNRLKQSYAFRYPKNLIEQKEQMIDAQTEQLEKGMKDILKQRKEMLLHLETRLTNQHPEKNTIQALAVLNQNVKQLHTNMKQIFEMKTSQLNGVIDKLSLLNPLEIMKRGFALPYNKNGKLMRSIDKIKIRDRLNIKFSNGTVDCEVLDVKENIDDERYE